MLNKNYLKLADTEYSSDNLLEALKYYAEVNSLLSLYSQAQVRQKTISYLAYIPS